MKTSNCKHRQPFAKFLQFKNICISLRYSENHVKLLYFSVFRVFEKNLYFFIFHRKGGVISRNISSEKRPNGEGNRKETRKNGRRKRSDCGTRFDWASFSPSVLLPLYPTSPYDKESYAMDIREKAGCPEVYSFPKKYKL